MRFFSVASLLLTSALALASPTQVLEERATKCKSGISKAASARVVSKFKGSGVVPTLIPSINPQVRVNVNYAGKPVKLGNSFTTAETLMTPGYSFTNQPGYNPSTTKYSFFLVDPDVPNPDAGSLRMTFLHWYTSGNSPGCLPNNATTVTIYEPLTPASTQEHRYTFLVYREPPNYSPDLVGAQLRPGFDVNSYASKAGLVLIGGNFLREAVTNT